MEFFQSGEMARLFHLSVSSIRHYEALGLVTPERIAPDNGYRYYSVRQFEAFNTIRYLRTLDMPLPEIADFLRNRDVDKIEEKLPAQKAAVAETQRELARIERKIDARLHQLQEAQAAPQGEIQLVLTQACRLTIAGFSREIAIIDQGFTHDRDKFITEICIPVKKQEP